MTEPYAVFYLSRLLHEEFNYLTAKEVFEDYFPSRKDSPGAWMLFGCSGTPTEMRLHNHRTSKGKNWLVVFPEGVSVGLSDTVMPFQPGMGRLHSGPTRIEEKGEAPHLLYSVSHQNVLCSKHGCFN